MTISNEGAVPSPDGPDDAEPTEVMRRFLSLCFNHAGRHVVTADALREVERLARRGSPDGGDLPALPSELQWALDYAESDREFLEAVAQYLPDGTRIGKAPGHSFDRAHLRAIAGRIGAFAYFAAHGVGALPTPREDLSQDAIDAFWAAYERVADAEDVDAAVRVGLRAALAKDGLVVAAGASRSGGGSAPDNERVCGKCGAPSGTPCAHWGSDEVFKRDYDSARGGGATPPPEGKGT